MMTANKKGDVSCTMKKPQHKDLGSIVNISQRQSECVTVTANLKERYTVP